MENKVRKELSDLCQSILNNIDEQDLISQLTHTQMLYEKLVVLNFLNEEKSNLNSDLDVYEETDNSEEIIEETPEKAREKVISLHPKFDTPIQKTVEPPVAKVTENNTVETPQIEVTEQSLGQQSINTKFGAQSLKIGLNDRIAFVKHLFNGEQHDFERVLSQLNTFSNFEEAQNFIEQMIKEDYGWAEKEEYEERFMKIIQARFGVE